MHSVNLVPARTQRLQARQARLRGWLTFNGCLLAAAAALTLQQWLALRGHSRVDAQARTQMEFESAERTRQLLAAGQERARLAALAELAVELEQPQSLPQHLGRLFAATPDTIALTSLTVQRQEPVRPARQPAARTGSPPAAPTSAPAAPAATLAVELRGYSLDYESLRALIASLEETIAPLRSELRETNLTPLLEGQAVSFLYDFAVGGDTP